MQEVRVSDFNERCSSESHGGKLGLKFRAMNFTTLPRLDLYASEKMSEQATG